MEQYMKPIGPVKFNKSYVIAQYKNDFFQENISL
jgi:hypothetical protein